MFQLVVSGIEENMRKTKTYIDIFVYKWMKAEKEDFGFNLILNMPSMMRKMLQENM